MVNWNAIAACVIGSLIGMVFGWAGVAFVFLAIGVFLVFER